MHVGPGPMRNVLTGRDVEHASAVRRQGHDTVLGSSNEASVIRGKHLDRCQPHIREETYFREAWGYHNYIR
jgi:hypothetical protein